VELIDEKAYCYDCLKEIVKDVRGESRKALTVSILVASLLSLLLAIVSLHDAYGLIVYISTYLYNGYLISGKAFDSTMLPEAPSLIIGLAFLVLSYGLAVTSRWSYKYSIVICVITFIFELTDAMNRISIEFLQKNPTSVLSIFYGIMVIGSLLVLIAVLESRRELTGW
jgi:hypothetical protein